MVASYVQLLARRYRGRLDADADEFIAYAVDGATRMRELINDLLAYSRVDTRGRNFQPVDSEEVLAGVEHDLSVAVEESGARIEHTPLPVVRADPVQFHQLLLNLLGNAIKFRQQGRSPEVRVGCVADGAFWRFTVQDNGIGIPGEFHERAFLVFQRLHGRDRYEGTGIGLAICKRIVERHGGSIGVESQPEQGATFWFTMPRAQGPEEKA